MIFINYQFAIRLANVLGIELPKINNEVLIPFGCKFGKIESNWYIKYYAYDKSDWIRLTKAHPFLQIAEQPLCDRYFIN